MKYGTIFSMDYEPRLRLMATTPHYPSKRGGMIWNAVNLFDSQYRETDEPLTAGWAPGSVITFDPDDHGVQIIEESL